MYKSNLYVFNTSMSKYPVSAAMLSNQGNVSLIM